MNADDDDDAYELRVAGNFDRHAAEILRLELGRLARQHDVEIRIRVEKTIRAPAPPRE